jgi:NTP pyrophosphatase (non-canonical NTP hydrolase)
MKISVMAEVAHANSRAKGFHEYTPRFGVAGRDARHILSWLALIVTEVAEAAEAVRTGDLANFGEELADVLIRCGDVAAALGVDLEAEVIKKMTRNAERPAMHGGKLA